jgi:hypothetical protein
LDDEGNHSTAEKGSRIAKAKAKAEEGRWNEK